MRSDVQARDTHPGAPARGVPVRASPGSGLAAPAARSNTGNDSATARRHHPLTRLLHWATVFLLLVAAGSICAHGYISDRALSRLLLAVHQTSGLTVFTLMLLRLAWRAYARVGGLHAAMPRRLRVGAALGHYAIHAATLTLAVLGWLTSNAFGLPLRFLGLLPLPILMARDRDLGDVLQDWHAGAAWVLLGLICGHIAAALWHHYVRRDDVLRSIQPSARRASTCSHVDVAPAHAIAAPAATRADQRARVVEHNLTMRFNAELHAAVTALAATPRRTPGRWAFFRPSSRDRKICENI